MQLKWKTYGNEMLRHAWRSLVFFPLLISSIWGLRNYVTEPAEQLWWSTAVDAAYTFSICASIYVIYGVFYFVQTKWGFREALERKFLVHILLSSIGVLVGFLIGDSFLAGDGVAPTMSSKQWFGSLLTGLLISLAFIFYYAYLKSQNFIRDLESSSLESKYRNLRSQMHPHFLFNSLNSLSELIHENPEEAAAMTVKLSNIYRGVLRSSNSKTARLETEMEIARDYLDLQKIRFGDRLSYEILPGPEQDIYVPSLMIQTLVENAVKHGIAPAKNGGHIAFGVTGEHGRYRFFLRNSGMPYVGERGDAESLGLANTRERLRLLYGDAGAFAIGTNKDGRTEASFTFSGAAFDS